MTASFTFQTLKKRSEFLRVRGGGRATASGFVLEGKRRGSVAEGKYPISGPRFGFTITKKIGNAVMRNRIRRRLRAALVQVAAAHADPQTDYVVVAREPAATQDFSALVADITKAFGKVHAPPLKRQVRG
jgi:ribonuclease P protein component